MIKLRPFNIDIVEIPLGEGDNRVPLPRGAQVLGTSVDEARQVAVMTVATDKDRVRDTEERRFMALPHGTAAPQTLGVLTYIGSPRLKATTLHVFEINTPEGKVRLGPTRGAAVVSVNTGNAAAGPGGIANTGIANVPRNPYADSGVYVQ